MPKRKKTNNQRLIDGFAKITMIVIVLFFIAFFFTTNKRAESSSYKSKIQVGNNWEDNTVRSEYNFSVPKSQAELVKETNSSGKVPNHFIRENSVPDSVKQIIDFIINAIPVEKEDVSINLDIDAALIADILELKEKDRKILLASMKRDLQRFVNKVYDKGYISLDKEDNKYKALIVQIPPKDKYYYKISNIYDEADVIKLYDKMLVKKYNKKYLPFLNYLLNEITIPDLVFDKKLTDDAIELAVRNITKTKYFIHKKEVLITKGDVISEEQHQKLSAYYNIRNAEKEDRSKVRVIIGNIGHGWILFLLIILYIVFLRKDIWNDNFMLSMFLSFSVITTFLAWLSERCAFSLPLEYLIFLPAFVLLINILIDARAAIVFALINALMIAGIANNDYVLGTTYLISCGITAYSFRNIKSFTSVFQSIILIIIGFALPIMLLGFETHTDQNVLLGRIAVSSINGVISPIIVFVVLIIFNKAGLLWRFNTDLELFTFDNKEHPLLKMMQEKAPGSYQHTLAVANLAEECAVAIGANADLTRVGAYYHDIGKALKAEYYTENQKGAIPNKHNFLSPRQSTVIIKEHVEKGMVLAKKYKLPKRISDFILMHHGTSFIKHFYAKAIEKYDRVDDSFYRYKGPKPQNKETAILMLCDASEAISRISNLTLEQLEEIIEKNIQEKINDHQLDDSGLTLKDIRTIKQVIANTILGMIHKRTTYKSIPEKKA